MAFVTITEIFDIIVMTLALGYIFGDVLGKYKPKEDYDPIAYYTQKNEYWESFKFACLVTAPAIILHELGHKIVAIYLGLQATFHAAYSWLGLGILLKMMNFGFIFFVPAYVTHSGNATHLESAAIAFAGPGVNLLLWLGSWYILLSKKPKKKFIPFLTLTKQINMFLFFFNMIPIGFFDGAHVFQGLIKNFLL